VYSHGLGGSALSNLHSANLLFLDVEEYDKENIVESPRNELMEAIYNQLPVEEYAFRNFRVVFDHLEIRREDGIDVVSESLEDL